MNRKTPLLPEYIDPIKLLLYEPKDEDTFTHVAWDKV